MKQMLVYVPGLGGEKTLRRQRAAINRWKNKNTNSLFLEPKWQDSNEDIESKLSRLYAQLNKINFMDYENVIFIGASAGGSLGLNLFNRYKKFNNLKFVSVCGKLKNVENVGRQYSSKNPAFIDSVLLSEEIQDKHLADSDKKRIISVIPLFDEVVNKKCMYFDGINTKRQFTIGHVLSIAYAIIFKHKSFKKL